MEEDDDRKGGGRGGSGGGEEAKPEVACGIDSDVGGGDAVDRVGIRRELGVEEVEETAVDGAVRAARGFEKERKQRGHYAELPWNGWFGGCSHCLWW